MLPEGVDPSFLAALPDNIRQEVIAEQLRLQRIQQRAQQQQQQAEALGVQEVNPEFLAALPPNIQEEVSFTVNTLLFWILYKRLYLVQPDESPPSNYYIGGSTESPLSNYYIGGSTCIRTSMYRVAIL